MTNWYALNFNPSILIWINLHDICKKRVEMFKTNVSTFFLFLQTFRSDFFGTQLLKYPYA